MATYRVISIDAGNKNTGIVLCDIDLAGRIDALDADKVDAPDTKRMQSSLMEYCQNKLVPFINAKPASARAIVLLEKVFKPKNSFKCNMHLVRLNKALAEYFQAQGSTVVYMMPSQKDPCPSGTNEDRKEASREAVIRFLESGLYPKIRSKIMGQARSHDMADALLMVRYFSTHSDMIGKAYTKTPYHNVDRPSSTKYGSGSASTPKATKVPKGRVPINAPIKKERK